MLLGSWTLMTTRTGRGVICERAKAGKSEEKKDRAWMWVVAALLYLYT
jgi:hypothetical protein